MADSKKYGPPNGFGEAPQAAFEGVPLSADISAWADEIAKESEQESKPKKDRGAKSTSKKPASKKQVKSSKDLIGEKRTGGGTIIGGSNDPKERVAAGLNPVAGVDVSLEEAPYCSRRLN